MAGNRLALEQLSFNLQRSQLSSEQQANFAKSGSNQLMMLPAGMLEDQAWTLATIIKSKCKILLSTIFELEKVGTKNWLYNLYLNFVFQLRNLILSAFPRNMRLPDPFTPNLKVELLPEISIAPRTVSNYAALIKPSFKKDLDSYLKNRSPVGFLSELRSNLLVASSGMSDTSPGNR